MKRQILLLVVALSVPGCAVFKECSEEHLLNVESPDSRYIAALFVRNCGATTSYVYHVNLRAASGSFTPNLSGTIYDGEVFDINSRKVEVLWKDEKTLLIKCVECSTGQPVNLESSWKDVSILYQPGLK